MALLYLAATYGEDRADKWLVIDDEDQAEAWQAEHPSGVVWRADIEVDGAPAA